jgi:hypothetical protein
MYWRGTPHYDPDPVTTARAALRKNVGANSLTAVLTEMAKYLAITATIYLFLAMAVSIL